jgi:hypothetical protein
MTYAMELIHVTDCTGQGTQAALLFATAPSSHTTYSPLQWQPAPIVWDIGEADHSATWLNAQPPWTRMGETHRSTARALLKHAGRWSGDDLDQCLRDVYASRAETEF